jgi:hypothetical protein
LRPVPMAQTGSYATTVQPRPHLPAAFRIAVPIARIDSLKARFKARAAQKKRQQERQQKEEKRGSRGPGPPDRAAGTNNCRLWVSTERDHAPLGPGRPWGHPPSPPEGAVGRLCCLNSRRVPGNSGSQGMDAVASMPWIPPHC